MDIKKYIKKILYSFDYPWIYKETTLVNDLAFNLSRFRVYSKVAKTSKKTKMFYRSKSSSTPVVLDQLSAANKDDFLVKTRKYGCSFIEDFLTEEEFSSVISEFENLTRMHKKKDYPVSKIGSGVRVVTGVIEHEVKTIFVEKLKGMVKESLGLKFSPSRRSMTIQILESESADFNDPNSTLHIDRFIPCLKFFYFPEEVTGESSPFGFVPYSHICNRAYEDAVIGGMKRYYNERTSPFSIDNPTSSRELQLTVPGNSLVAAYTNGLHRRVPFLQSGEFGLTRKSLRFDFYGSFNKFSLLKGLL